MKNDASTNTLAGLGKRLSGAGAKLRKYALVLFLVFVLGVYGLTVFRIHTLLTAEPSPDEVSSQVKANGIPKVDPKVVNQLQTLRDNSVNVQALFDQGRNNPFQ